MWLRISCSSNRTLVYSIHLCYCNISSMYNFGKVDESQENASGLLVVYDSDSFSVSVPTSYFDTSIQLVDSIYCQHGSYTKTGICFILRSYRVHRDSDLFIQGCQKTKIHTKRKSSRIRVICGSYYMAGSCIRVPTWMFVTSLIDGFNSRIS